MDIDHFIPIGMAILVFWVFLMREYEKRWFPPSFVVAVMFFFHAFFAPSVYFQIGNINTDALDDVMRLTVSCFGALVIGYWIVQALTKKETFSQGVLPVQGAFGIRIIGLIIFAILAYQTFYFIFSGVLTLSKGVGAYKTDASVAERIAKVGLLIPAFMMAWRVNIQATVPRIRRKALACWYIALSWNMGLSMLLFARRMFFETMLLSVLFVHYRVKPFSPRLVAAVTAVIFVVIVSANLRLLNVGIADLDFETILTFFIDKLGEAPKLLFYGIAMSLPGQNVFAEVVNLVPATYPYQLGRTYLDSFIGLLLPRFLGLSSFESINTPAHWFREAFDPTVENHGYDFSTLSEAYLNFGEMMPIVFVVLGMLIAKASNTIRTSNSYAKTVLSVLCIVGITLGFRSDSNTLVKSIIYPFIGVILVSRVESFFHTIVGKGAVKKGRDTF